MNDSRRPSRPLRRLAALYGVQSGYLGNDGLFHGASAESLDTVLQLLGCVVKSEAEVRAAIRARRQEKWERLIEPVVVSWEGAEPSDTDWLVITVDCGQKDRPMTVELQLEDGARLSVDSGAARPHARLRRLPNGLALTRMLVPLPPIPYGYHRVQVGVGSKYADSLLIRAPRRSFRATDKEDETEQRRFGVFAPLYALHSSSSWGIGDFSDLETACELTARMGGSFFSTLPALALAQSLSNVGESPSPYSPGTRRRWNELFVDPRRAPEWIHCRRELLTPELEGRIRRTREVQRVPYVEAAAIRREVLSRLALECERRRPEALENYRASDPDVIDYARFRAFQEVQSSDWRQWPAKARDGYLSEDDVPGAAARFHTYSQLLAEEQVRLASRSARDRNVSVYFDFPLGVAVSGYDAWREQESFVLDAELGAPPDHFFTAGQNWGLPPHHPERARFDEHRYLRQSLGHSMRHASMLRIDHVMGFHRQFWIASGMENRDGVYVRYPASELYAVANLESHRNRCELVGENLGTVPEYVNDSLKKHGWRGMYVLQFALTGRLEAPAVPPPRESISSINTHDTPTFAGFCRGRDIEERIASGALDSSRADQERRNRSEALAALDRYLGIETDGEASLRERLFAWISYLLECDAGRAVVSLEDLWLEEEPQNRPGTVAATNWSRRLRYDLDTLLKDRELLPALPIPR